MRRAGVKKLEPQQAIEFYLKTYVHPPYPVKGSKGMETTIERMREVEPGEEFGRITMRLVPKISEFGKAFERKLRKRVA